MDKILLLTDMEMVGFLVNGYHLLELDLPGETNERIAGQLDDLDYNPGDAIAEVVPGTQFRNTPTDRMATYTNIRGQVPMVLKAGTLALTHYDLQHGTAANRTAVKRHMIKFLFRRVRDNKTPTWNHDPDTMNVPTAWGGKREDPKNVLSFGNGATVVAERPSGTDCPPEPKAGTLEQLLPSWIGRQGLPEC